MMRPPPHRMATTPTIRLPKTWLAVIRLAYPRNDLLFGWLRLAMDQGAAIGFAASGAWRLERGTMDEPLWNEVRVELTPLKDDLRTLLTAARQLAARGVAS